MVVLSTGSSMVKAVILDHMLKGKIQMGNAHQTQLRWDQDTLDNCSPEDQVWGWSIRSLEVLHQDHTKFDSEVLCKMLYSSSPAT